MIGKWSLAFSPRFWRLGGRTTVEVCQGCGREEEGRLLSSGSALPDLDTNTLASQGVGADLIPTAGSCSLFPSISKRLELLKCFHSGGGRNGDLSKLADPCKLPAICSEQNEMYFTNLVA